MHKYIATCNYYYYRKLLLLHQDYFTAICKMEIKLLFTLNFNILVILLVFCIRYIWENKLNSCFLMIRALNYSVAKQDFTIVLITLLIGISEIVRSLRNGNTNTINTGVCVITNDEAEQSNL